MEALATDLRLALRALAARPAFALAASLTLGVAIGGNAAVFGIVDAILLRALPYEQPDRLVVVWESKPETPERPVAPANFLDWRQQASSFTSLSSWMVRDGALRTGDAVERVDVAAVSADFLRTLGAQMVLGRGLTEPDRDLDPAPVVVSEGLWRSQLGGRTDVLAAGVQLDGVQHPVVGVAAASVAWPTEADIWMPVPHDVAPAGPAGIDLTTWRDAWYLGVIGRLRAGTTLDQASAELGAIAERLRAEYPETNADSGVVVRPLIDEVVQDTRPVLVAVGGLAALLLALAVVNLVNLAIARLAERARELAVRRALGAGTPQVLRQLLAEGQLLAAGGVAVAVPVAILAQRALVGWLPADTPRLGEVALDWRAFALAWAVAALIGAVVGAAPVALAGTGSSTQASLLRGGGSAALPAEARRASRLLVTAQLALAVGLLTAAGLMAGTLARLAAVDPGYRADGIVGMRIDLPGGGDPAANAADLLAMVQRAGDLPETRAAGGLVSVHRGGPGAGLRVEGRTNDGDPPDVQWTLVTDGYFELLGIPLLRGRTFSGQDDDRSEPVALLNATAARLFFEGADVLDQRVRTGLDGTEGNWVRVVGVVGDVHDQGLDAPPLPRMYRPMRQTTRWNPGGMQLLVRAPGDTAALVSAARAAIAQVRADVPVSLVRPLQEVLREEQTSRRLAAMLASAFSAGALLLAVIGVHGLLAAAVTARRAELALRLSLGATPARLRRDVFAGATSLVAQGLAGGGLLAWLAERSLRGLIWGTSLSDGRLLLLAVAALLAAAGVGAFLPARAAARTDPMRALRGQ